MTSKTISTVTKKIAESAMKETVEKCRWFAYQPVVPEKVIAKIKNQ